MKDLGGMRYFPCIKIDKNDASFFLSQNKYTIDLLKEFGMYHVKPLHLSMKIHLKLTLDKEDLLSDPTPYQRFLGKLIYLTITRPYICFTLQLLSQYMHQPTIVHMQAGKRLFRYLSGTHTQGIFLASSSGAHLTAYCDSDWASCLVTRRSTICFCIFLGQSSVSWKTKKKQLVVASSCTEVEYKSMALTTCEVTWLSALLKDLGLKHLPSTILHCDNLAALAITANLVFYERTSM